MFNPVATVGSFLVKKLGKELALAVMFTASKVILFTMISAFVGTLLSLLFTTYNAIKSILDKIESLATNNVTGATDCISIISSAVFNNLGFIEAFNIVGPTLMLVYFTYFNAILLGFSLSIYRFINNTVTEFAMVVK